MSRASGGTNGETRSSALWGTGNRGGDSRANALWGKGGRRYVIGLVALLVIGAPVALSASGAQRTHARAVHDSWVSAGLLRGAKRHPSKLVRVIIQSRDGTTATARQAFNRVDRLDDSLNDRETVNHRLGVIDAVSVTLRAEKVAELAKLPNLVVTADVPMRATGFSTRQLWPAETTIKNGWGVKSTSTPTIAVIDSGIESGRLDFGARVLASVNLSTLPGNSPGDGRGHGTFVAGIAAGAGTNYAGAVPQTKLVSLDVMDDQGMARTSDVIAACQWILANKATYKIRVANLSLHSTAESNFMHDPLDRAVEQLWFSGVVVVAAAGNYATGDGPSGVVYAPANDPFVITVGAVDIAGTTSRSDDFNAPWSSYGYTHDGFAKPELSAPGRYIVGPVPMTSTLAAERADKIVAPGYVQLSGTSFAAPMVAGAAALVLAKHPLFTPDQVKGALMLSAKPALLAAPGSAGVGEVAYTTQTLTNTPPNPNKALDAFVVAGPDYGSIPVFDAASWSDTATANASWDSASWSDAVWSTASWSDASWSDVSWSDVSWSDVSWSDVSWSDVSWSDVSWDSISVRASEAD